jgi:hypothetical protein
LKKHIILVSSLIFTFLYPTSANASGETQVEILTSNILDLKSANVEAKITTNGVNQLGNYDIRILVSNSAQVSENVKFDFGVACPCKGNLLNQYGGQLEFKGLIRNTNILENPFVQIRFTINNKHFYSKVVNISKHKRIVFSKSIIPLKKLPFEATESSTPEATSDSPSPSETSYNGGGGGGSQPTPTPSESIWETKGIDGQPQTLSCIQNVRPIWDASTCTVIGGSNLPYLWVSENGKQFYYDGQNYVENHWSYSVPCDPKAYNSERCIAKKNDPGYFFTNTPKPKDIFKPIVLTTAQVASGELPKEVLKKKKQKNDSEKEKEVSVENSSSPSLAKKDISELEKAKERLNDVKKDNQFQVDKEKLKSLEETPVQNSVVQRIFNPVTKFISSITNRLLSIFN